MNLSGLEVYYLVIEMLLTQPHGKILVFWPVTEQMRVWGDPGGSGGSENHIWQIFYRAVFEIGTPGTPRGVPRDHNFFLNNFLGKSY